MPKALGIIMDGNRRYARSRGLPLLEGHRQGAKKLQEVVEWAKEIGIEELTVYAFSTENWNRSEEEVGYLMKLLEEALTTDLAEFHTKQVQVRFIGERTKLPPGVVGAMESLENNPPQDAVLTLIIALSYGGRAELVEGVRKLVACNTKDVTEESFQKELWSGTQKEVDMVIRTGGEKRLSNFLTWQTVYSELFFLDTLWPELTKDEFLACVEEYRERDRRRGR